MVLNWPNLRFNSHTTIVAGDQESGRRGDERPAGLYNNVWENGVKKRRGRDRRRRQQEDETQPNKRLRSRCRRPFPEDDGDTNTDGTNRGKATWRDVALLQVVLLDTVLLPTESPIETQMHLEMADIQMETKKRRATLVLSGDSASSRVEPVGPPFTAWPSFG